MCDSFDGCDGCPGAANACCFINDAAWCKNPEGVVAAVEQWAKDHPAKTRQSEFLKMFPNAPKSGRVLTICPKDLNIDYMPPKRCENISCSDCKTDYWNEEVTDND